MSGTQPIERVSGYDLARGFAILVMVVLNFKGVLASTEGAPLWISQAMEFMDRRAAAALVMISGAGVTLYHRQGGDALINRALFLFFSGLALTLMWSGDILHFYGVFIGIGILLARCSGKVLAGFGLAAWILGWARYLPAFELIEAGWGTWPADFLADLLFTGYFPVFPWAAFFALGMGLGRWDIGRSAIRSRLWVLGLALAAAAGILSAVFPADWAVIDLSVPTPLSVVSGMGTGLLLILASVELSLRCRGAVLRLSAAAGRTSLSFYIFHILAIHLLTAGGVGAADLRIIAGGAVGFFLIYGIWAQGRISRGGKGPLEAAMRKFVLIRH